mmetsp:Transcript_1244/g.1384  ORF Transcript_1244/g.1384 Transcript_1244/m.1384 type:complete len:298 (-) Transcript_1244:194-1087(-)|eukprot:CAMPEP_0205827024 /NCGR_PEP_ID=MMETSP0206-20130828/30576_1 /ASSEMBLY_ACC=CAM_ASM_000279 /TAXON_ID=36767 /ORGANISM="Euplotes focardii, Strain TN1" /LENGTH=297 /DNA_ID=CAMNT_0053127497 /DNA_START=33 /DNA_END=926 /DNA_ORIENTATION=+
MPLPDSVIHAATDIGSGTFGGISQVLVGHPLDTIKVRLQATNEFKGMLDCFTKTVKGEGVMALYKGSMSPLGLAMAYNALSFFAFGQSKELVRKLPWRNSNKPLSGTELALAGAMAGAVNPLVDTPMELFKNRLQAQVGSGQYKGVVDCAKQTVARYGFRGVYHGNVAMMLRDIPQVGCYFWGYSVMSKYLSVEGEEPSLPAVMAAGGFAGFMAWSPLVAPFDFIKTRIQADSIDPAKRQYRGVVHCITKTLQHEGWRAFYKGYLPMVVRAVPVNACIFAAVKSTKQHVFGGKEANH